MATIRDISEKTGYSIATISRVLNFDATLSVSEHAKEQIFKVAQELNYRTLKERSSLQEKKSRRIGMLQLNSDQEEINDPYYLAIRLGIEKKCQAHGIELIKILRQSDSIDISKIKQLDGVIIVGNVLTEDIVKLQTITNNFTFVDHSPMEDKYDSVVIDFRKSMIEVLDHLFSLNHQEIGFIGGVQRKALEVATIMDDREVAFREYMTKKGRFKEQYVFTGQFTTEEGYRLMTEALLLPKLPSAFFVASDSMAIGALRVLHENNIQVPDQVSIIGFNDIAAASYLQPSLSTVKVYTEFMGETAVELLMERLKTNRKIPKKVVIPTELIKRESTGKRQ